MTTRYGQGQKRRSQVRLCDDVVRFADDGMLVMLDNRRVPAQQTFETLNPSTGEKQSLVDSARALADLKRAVDGLNIDALPWPLAFNGSGKQALYIFKGDVFVLDLATVRILACGSE